ncbi:TRAP transporter small permease [Elioraea rosea]|uniref:TRAP transporter small permease n=1 Tax=Elioraea rosea TaxID=2492390 RepID=UPI0011849355|nr:TRAP transporter small permease [Elioraea rosea]
MKSAVAALSALLDVVARVVIGLAGLALVALVAITGWMVFGRYVLNDTPTWVERAALLAMLFVALPVAAVGVRERFHMAVEFVLAALPRGPRTVVRVVCDLLMLGFGIIMAVWGNSLAEAMWSFKIPLIGLSQGLQYVPLVICGTLTAVFSAEHLLRRAAGLDPLGQHAHSLD